MSAALMGAIACGAGGSGADVVGAKATSTCERLDSRLFELTTSSAMTSAPDIDVDADGVLVTIEVKAGALAPTRGVKIVATHANFMDARVPIALLCATARDPAVIAVRVPTRGVPEGGRP